MGIMVLLASGIGSAGHAIWFVLLAPAGLLAGVLIRFVATLSRGPRSVRPSGRCATCTATSCSALEGAGCASERASAGGAPGTVA